jgi:HEAT repeat protein
MYSDESFQTFLNDIESTDNNVEMLRIMRSLIYIPNDSATTALLNFAASASPQQHRFVEQALMVAPKSAVAELACVAISDKHEIAQIAKRVLLFRAEPDSLPFLLRLSKSKLASDVDDAYRALGRIASADARAPLFKGLTHRTKNIRLTAAYSIAERREAQWIPDIANAIRELNIEEYEKKKDYAEIVSALKHAIVLAASPSALTLLIDGLQNQDPDVCEACVNALASVADTSIVPLLLELLEQPGRNLRYKPRGFISPLLVIRVAIVDALGTIADRRAIPALIGLLPDTKTVLSTRAALALGKLQAGEAIDALFDVLKGARVPLEQDVYIDAIAQLDGENVVLRLQSELNSDSLLVRTAAALGLRRHQPIQAEQTLKNIMSEYGATAHRSVAKALAEMRDRTFPVPI